MITKKHILWTFLSLVALAMLTGIAAVVLPSGWIDEKVLITIFIVGAYSLAGIVIVSVAPKHNNIHGNQRLTLQTCTIGLALSMVLFITLLWFESWIGYQRDQYFWKPALIGLVVGLAAAHRMMIVPLINPLRSFQIVKRTTIIAASLMVALIIYGVIFDGYGTFDEIAARLIAIAAIITAGSTIATGAIAIFAPKPGEGEQSSFDTSIPITLTCPRCTESIQAKSNKESRCQSCKLKVRVQINEPRCACGYLLYQLNADTCPECGKPIPTTEQWGSNLTGSNAAQSASGAPSQMPS
tara:strand:- start:44236 stop:45126 length:891 start_codon:yes stop_codon:yes gene_type:complete